MDERDLEAGREGSHRGDTGDSRRLAQIDHDLQVLWDLRRRELAGEEINLEEDYFDRFTVDPGSDAPGR